MARPRVSIIGLGKLGTCLAARLAHKGFDVIGMDVESRIVESLRTGTTLIREPGLAEMLAANRTRLRATTNVEEAVLASDISLIIVPTPSEEHGGFSLRCVNQAVREISRALAVKSGYHLVVLTSTVLPGSTGGAVRPLLEDGSGKRCGPDFGLCYSPLFISLGSVLRDLSDPDVVLIGESDERAGWMLESLHRLLCDNSPHVARMNFINAELTKLAVNTYITTKISFANMLAGLCERLPGADIDVVTKALGADSRIGGRYLTGAISYGGPCFPRDNRAMSRLAKQLGCDAFLAESTDRINDTHAEQVLARIQEQLEPGAAVGVLGLSYKPDTDVVEESAGLELARALAEAGFHVVVHDPLALDNVRRILGERVTYADSLQACLDAVEAVVIANPAKEFHALAAAQIPLRAKPFVVFDCWRILRGKLGRLPSIRYIAIGLAEDGAVAEAVGLQPGRAG